MRFVDTNIAIYAVTTDPEDERKQRISEALLNREAGNLALSIQVLGEFYAQVTRPSRPYSMGHGEAVTVMQTLQHNHVQPLTQETLDEALQYRGEVWPQLLGLPDYGSRQVERMRRRVLRGHEYQPRLRWRSGHQPIQDGLLTSVGIRAAVPVKVQRKSEIR